MKEEISIMVLLAKQSTVVGTWYGSFATSETLLRVASQFAAVYLSRGDKQVL